MLYLASDHAGYNLKEKIKNYLVGKKIAFCDIGPFKFDPQDDYPDFAHQAALQVAKSKLNKGIVICSSGIGVSIVANKVKGIRCGLVCNPQMAKQSRRHNNTNMIALGANYLTAPQALKIIDLWLKTPFSQAPRRRRRIEKIAKIEKLL